MDFMINSYSIVHIVAPVFNKKKAFSEMYPFQ